MPLPCAGCSPSLLQQQEVAAGLTEPWVPACSCAPAFVPAPSGPPSPHSQSELPTVLIRHCALCLQLAHTEETLKFSAGDSPNPVTSPLSALPTFQHVPATLACFLFLKLAWLVTGSGPQHFHSSRLEGCPQSSQSRLLLIQVTPGATSERPAQPTC